jgi:hypothetical protein
MCRVADAWRRGHVLGFVRWVLSSVARCECEGEQLEPTALRMRICYAKLMPRSCVKRRVSRRGSGCGREQEDRQLWLNERGLGLGLMLSEGFSTLMTESFPTP